MNDRYLCLMCHGSGFFAELEGDREVRDTCLHCQGKGYVPYNVAFVDSVVALCEAITEALVMNQKKVAAENEEGEGWAFHAAENRMTEYDYTRARVWGSIPLVEKDLKSLSPPVLNALLSVAKIDTPLYLDPKEVSAVETEDTDIEEPPF